jgi:transposase
VWWRRPRSCCGRRGSGEDRCPRRPTLARLLHLGEIAAVTVPSVEQEAARDLVRAREDCRGDVMSARHRVSKLLLRQGIVYYGGATWTAKHEQWLRTHRFDAPGLQLAYDAALDAMLATLDRRNRLDAAIISMAADSAYTPVVTRLGCLRGVSTLTAFGLATEIGDWDRLSGRSIGAYLGLVPTEYSSGSTRSRGGSPRPATATPDDCWSKRRGITDPGISRAASCGGGGMRRRRRRGRGGRQPIGVCMPGGSVLMSARNAPWLLTRGSPANWPAGAGR